MRACTDAAFRSEIAPFYRTQQQFLVDRTSQETRKEKRGPKLDAVSCSILITP
jgi:hypothetical protein